MDGQHKRGGDRAWNRRWREAGRGDMALSEPQQEVETETEAENEQVYIQIRAHDLRSLNIDNATTPGIEMKMEAKCGSS